MSLSRLTSSPRDPLRVSRLMIREAAAEFTGVALIIIFGNGVDCQAILSMNDGVAAFPRGVSEVIKFVSASLKCSMNRIGCPSLSAGGLGLQWESGWQVEFLALTSILRCVGGSSCSQTERNN